MLQWEKSGSLQKHMITQRSGKKERVTVSRMQKNERIGVITQILTENPNKIFTLTYFAELLSSAKSTLSEDLDIIQEIFNTFQLGRIETISGAAGGVIYRPTMGKEQIAKFCEELCSLLRDSKRVIPGGYIYMNDIVYSPQISSKIGRALANEFYGLDVDMIVTIETKGIPIALMTARALNKPLVVVRKEARLTEGTVIHMNYISGSSKRIQTMSLPKRSIPKGSKVIFIDDFMKAGGTVRGIIDLMKEFEAEVVGVGVFMATAEPENKLLDRYQALLLLDHVNEDQKEIHIRPFH